jgi:hypothetical protein
MKEGNIGSQVNQHTSYLSELERNNLTAGEDPAFD